MIAVMVLSLIVQQTLTNRFKKYSKVGINMSGAEVSARMMADNGINDVKIGSVNGQLTDHYDPSKKTINLSDSVYAQRNIAAAAVAAHETGHCIQHAKGYGPLKLRSAMVPVVSFANNTVQWVLLAGIIFINVFPALLWAVIALFALTLRSLPSSAWSLSPWKLTPAAAPSPGWSPPASPPTKPFLWQKTPSNGQPIPM